VIGNCKSWLAAFALCATLLIGGCVTDGVGIDIRVHRTVEGRLIAERRGYCVYRYEDGRIERVRFHKACPPYITREIEEHRR